MWMLLTFFLTPGPFTYYTYSHLSAGWHEVIVPKTTKRVVIRDAEHRNRVTLPLEDGLR